jgi:hypothetical protein
MPREFQIEKLSDGSVSTPSCSSAWRAGTSAPRSHMRSDVSAAGIPDSRMWRGECDVLSVAKSTAPGGHFRRESRAAIRLYRFRKATASDVWLRRDPMATGFAVVGPVACAPSLASTHGHRLSCQSVLVFLTCIPACLRQLSETSSIIGRLVKKLHAQDLLDAYTTDVASAMRVTSPCMT